jgi:hypothetical protein
LISITIPESVVEMGKNVFQGCNSLTIHCRNNSVAWRYAEENGIKHEELPDVESASVLESASGSASVPEPARAKPRGFDWFRKRK